MSFALTHALRLAPCARAQVDAIFLFILDLNLVDCAVLSKQHQRREEKIIIIMAFTFYQPPQGRRRGVQRRRVTVINPVVWMSLEVGSGSGALGTGPLDPQFTTSRPRGGRPRGGRLRGGHPRGGRRSRASCHVPCKP